MVYDLIILGGGHAGVEAAYCASQFDLNIGIITLPDIGLASAPCNPSIGGIGKGQVVKEIDALGGLMGILADLAGIQYRTLNESKGIAVQSSRIQIDKIKYSRSAEQIIGEIPNIFVIRNLVKTINVHDFEDLKFELCCADGSIIKSKSLIITTGTFLGGVLHCGSDIQNGGRHEQVSSPSIFKLLGNQNIKSRRFKTGTPARIKSSSIDFSKIEEQPSDKNVRNMHLWNKEGRATTQVSCYLSRTNSDTLELIRKNKEQSPMYNGQITAIGARYCPSIEDKAYRYPDKDIHHVFLEPESLELDTYYPSGISTSLPKSIQKDFIRTINGLENAEIAVFGYAVEYDVMDTSQLSHTLEHKNIKNLYFAGQVNGTSGYEEAAGQGLITGFNAALSLTGQEPLVLNRAESYIGLMIDDLATTDRDEPYRLFTARSENRLYLREDNAFIRMVPYRNKLNLTKSHDNLLNNLFLEYNLCNSWLNSLGIDQHWTAFLASLPFTGPDITPADLLKDPGFDPREIMLSLCKYFNMQWNKDVINAVAVEAKYKGYIDRSKEQQQSIEKLEKKRLNLQKIATSKNVSFECKQRIAKFNPETFGDLKRLSGIRPATLAVVATDSL